MKWHQQRMTHRSTAGCVYGLERRERKHLNSLKMAKFLKGLIIVLVSVLSDRSEEVEVQEKLVNTTAGHSVTLPCLYNTSQPLDTSLMRIYWQRLPNTVVIMYNKGNLDMQYQNAFYGQRAHLFLSELKWGNFSLQLSSVQPADDGEIHMVFTDKDKKKLECKIQLHVGVSFRKPTVNFSKCMRGREMVDVTCDSGGGLPIPSVLWSVHDVAINGTRVMTSSHRETDTGTYSVQSNIRLNLAPGQMITCTIINPTLSQNQSTSVITCVDEGQNVLIPMLVIGVVVLLAVGFFLLCYFKRREISHNQYIHGHATTAGSGPGMGSFMQEDNVQIPNSTDV